MRFRGREKAFVDLGKQKLEKIIAQLSDVGTIYESNLRSKSLVSITVAPD